jgi:hypothetical protein
MPKFLLTYRGGRGMPESEADQAKEMQAWGAWFGQLGDAVADGGNPISATRTISANGSVTDGAAATNLGGFSIISAANIDAAVALAKGCPVLANGGDVDVSETFEIEM